MRTLVNFVLFQAAWFVCVLGAAEGNGWIGPAAVVAFAAIHFGFCVTDRRAEALLVVAVAVGGPLVSAFNVANGAVVFGGADLSLGGVPLWIVALWAAFAMTLRHCLGWVRGRLAWAALAGLLGSPLSYRAAEGLGALDLNPDPARGLLVVGLTWGVAVPLCALVAERVGPEKPPTDAVEPSVS